jgi:hypothetical protein
VAPAAAPEQAQVPVQVQAPRHHPVRLALLLDHP